MAPKLQGTTSLEDIEGRIAILQGQIDMLLQMIPPGLVQNFARVEARVQAIEQQEDPLEPIVHEPLDFGPTIPVRGRQITITGTRDRYVWVYYTTDPATAEYRDITQDPMPDGVEIYDTAYLPWNLPRIG